MTVRILVGDCREHLRSLDADSVHCCATSPPYWGLRDYGVEATIWGGDPECGHEFGSNIRETGGSAFQGKNGQRADRTNIIEQEKLRDGGCFCNHCGAWRGSFGLEPTYQLYIEHAVEIFREVRRVLRPDGTLWLNLGDSYATGAGKVGDHPGGGEQGARWRGEGSKHDLRKEARPNADGRGEPQSASGIGPIIQPNRMPQAGLKPKDLVGIPWMVAFALRADGWWLRDCIVWNKPNPMPESVTDRTTKSHEFVFLLAKSERYYYDADAITEDLAPSSIPRLQQDTGAQVGSARVPGREDRAMKAVGGEGAKRNKRSVWTIPTQAFGGEFCRSCRTFFEGDALASLGVEVIEDQGRKRRVRYCSCGCAPDQWLSHFATFPPDLIEIPILAGTSEKGCCSSCGSPWVRKTEPTERYAKHLGKSFHDHSDDLAGGMMQMRGENAQNGIFADGIVGREVTTIGWEPGCKCKAPVKPCTVLDPFGGAGTTGLVADRLRRAAVLLEINPEYAEMARQRLGSDGGMFAKVSLEAPAKEAAE